MCWSLPLQVLYLDTGIIGHFLGTIKPAGIATPYLPWEDRSADMSMRPVQEPCWLAGYVGSMQKWAQQRQTHWPRVPRLPRAFFLPLLAGYSTHVVGWLLIHRLWEVDDGQFCADRGCRAPSDPNAVVDCGVKRCSRVHFPTRRPVDEGLIREEFSVD
ncbi:hypothetical protein VTI28DRAFT_7239 [Corynascus sepedonium]